MAAFLSLGSTHIYINVQIKLLNIVYFCMLKKKPQESNNMGKHNEHVITRNSEEKRDTICTSIHLL